MEHTQRCAHYIIKGRDAGCQTQGLLGEAWAAATVQKQLHGTSSRSSKESQENEDRTSKSNVGGKARGSARGHGGCERARGKITEGSMRALSFTNFKALSELNVKTDCSWLKQVERPYMDAAASISMVIRVY